MAPETRRPGAGGAPALGKFTSLDSKEFTASPRKNQPAHEATPATVPIIASNWKAIEGRGSLLGFVDLTIVSYGLSLLACPVHKTSGRIWVGLPGKPQFDRAGTVLRDAAGKVKYLPTVLVSRSHGEKFQQRALEALRAIGALP